MLVRRMKSNLREFARKILGVGDRSKNATTLSLASYVDDFQLYPPDQLLRLGTAYGGWIIPRKPSLIEGSVCYSAGAGEDISFDCALAKLFRCRVRIVDPTPRAAQHFHQFGMAVRGGGQFSINGRKDEFYDITQSDFARLDFVPFGLAGVDAEMKFFLPKNPEHVSCSMVNLQKTNEYFTAQCYRLSTLMAKNGDTRLDLFKMDIEGGEYAVIEDLLASKLLPEILLVEFDEVHTPMDKNAGNRIGETISKLSSAGMRCIAIENSNATFVKA